MFCKQLLRPSHLTLCSFSKEKPLALEFYDKAWQPVLHNATPWCCFSALRHYAGIFFLKSTCFIQSSYSVKTNTLATQVYSILLTSYKYVTIGLHQLPGLVSPLLIVTHCGFFSVWPNRQYTLKHPLGYQ